MNGWLDIHPKVKALGIAVLVLVLGSLVGGINGSVTWNEVASADAIGIIGLLVAYLTPASGASKE